MTEKEYSSPTYYASVLRQCLSRPGGIFPGGVNPKHSGREGELVSFTIGGTPCVVRFLYEQGAAYAQHEILDSGGNALRAYKKRFSPKRSAAGRISEISMERCLGSFLNNNLRTYGRKSRTKQ